MKIYTRRGDRGETGLFGGQRVSKASRRVAAYGTVDEANSHLGVALSLLPDSPLRPLILSLQEQLFALGADLATPPHPSKGQGRVPRIGDEHVSLLEKHIDDLEESLPPLKTFILPGGHPAAAHLHVARAVCRRAERLAVAARKEGETISDAVLSYLNRLSDLLFVLARAVNSETGTADIPWNPPS